MIVLSVSWEKWTFNRNSFQQFLVRLFHFITASSFVTIAELLFLPNSIKAWAMHFILRTILGQLRESTLSRPIADILNVCARTNDWRLYVCANDTKYNGKFYTELVQFFWQIFTQDRIDVCPRPLYFLLRDKIVIKQINLSLLIQ